MWYNLDATVKSPMRSITGAEAEKQKGKVMRS